MKPTLQLTGRQKPVLSITPKPSRLPVLRLTAFPNRPANGATNARLAKSKAMGNAKLS